MKKIFVSMCGFIFICMLVGCSKVEATNEQQSNSNEQVEEKSAYDELADLITEALADSISNKVSKSLNINVSFFEECQLQYRSGKITNKVVEISDKKVSVNEKHHLIVDNEDLGNIDLKEDLQSIYSEYVTEDGTWVINPNTKDDSHNTLEYWEKGKLEKSFKLEDFENKDKESNLYQIVKVEHDEIVIGQGTTIMFFDGEAYETIARDVVEVIVDENEIIFRTVNGQVYTFCIGESKEKREIKKIADNAIALSKNQSNYVIKEETKDELKSFNIVE